MELDTVSAGIAQQLYQKSSIAAQGFEETNLPDSFFDAVVGLSLIHISTNLPLLYALAGLSAVGIAVCGVIGFKKKKKEDRN